MDGISRFNHEGYYDPTAYEAFANIDQEERAAGRNPNYRPLCYICSPYRGNVAQNTKNARLYCQMAIERGYLPICPHIYLTQFLDDNIAEERALGLFMGLVLLTKCAEVWVFGDTVSEGMKHEIQKAESRRMPVRYFKHSGEEVRT